MRVNSLSFGDSSISSLTAGHMKRSASEGTSELAGSCEKQLFRSSRRSLWRCFSISYLSFFSPSLFVLSASSKGRRRLINPWKANNIDRMRFLKHRRPAYRSQKVLCDNSFGAFYSPQSWVSPFRSNFSGPFTPFESIQNAEKWRLRYCMKGLK